MRRGEEKGKKDQTGAQRKRVRFGEDDGAESSSGDRREPRRIPPQEDDVSENMREILAINAAARAAGQSYGYFVVTHTRSELAEVVYRFLGAQLSAKVKRKK